MCIELGAVWMCVRVCVSVARRAIWMVIKRCHYDVWKLLPNSFEWHNTSLNRWLLFVLTVRRKYTCAWPVSPGNTVSDWMFMATTSLIKIVVWWKEKQKVNEIFGWLANLPINPSESKQHISNWFTGTQKIDWKIDWFFSHLFRFTAWFYHRFLYHWFN